MSAKRHKATLLRVFSLPFSRGVDLNYWRGGRPSKAGTPSAMRWKG